MVPCVVCWKRQETYVCKECGGLASLLVSGVVPPERITYQLPEIRAAVKRLQQKLSGQESA